MSSHADTTFLTDCLAVRGLIDRYTDAINRLDWAALPSLFAERAVWEASGAIELRFEGRDIVVGALQSMVGSLDFLFQYNGAVVIDLEGERARARVCLSEVGRDKSGRGIHNHGVYFDDLVKRDGQWCFVRRSFRFRYAEESSLSGQVFPLTPPESFRSNS